MRITKSPTTHPPPTPPRRSQENRPQNSPGRTAITPLRSKSSSLAEIGLINPVTLNKELRLITGYHRLEAAKALGWEQIDARVLELDDLEAELLEIDENLRRYDLTAWEQSQHIERREVLLKRKGERATPRDNHRKDAPATVTGAKTTADLAAEAGMSKRTYARRAAVGRDIAPATADILNAITDLATCDLPDSPKQLEYLAKLEAAHELAG